MVGSRYQRAALELLYPTTEERYLCFADPSYKHVLSPESVRSLKLQGDAFIARGAKGDQEIRHHPLVREHLSTVDSRGLVRGVGAERGSWFVSGRRSYFDALLRLAVEEIRQHANGNVSVLASIAWLCAGCLHGP